MDILEEIVAHKRREVEQQKQEVPPKTLYRKVEKLMESGTLPRRSMREALAESNSGIIAEFKRKSPSKGWIKEEGRAEVIPQAYCQNGAAAVSILTDERYFGGSLEFVTTARPLVNCPILRKDFIVDEYQVFQARAIGANAILLIAADLKAEECRTLAKRAHELGLETLLEVHSREELDMLGDDIDMLGVNNRHLGSFNTDVNVSLQLAPHLPEEFLRVSESGLGSAETVRLLRQVGYRGFLMGETFMKTPDPGKALGEFIAQLQ